MKTTKKGVEVWIAYLIYVKSILLVRLAWKKEGENYSQRNIKSRKKEEKREHCAGVMIAHEKWFFTLPKKGDMRQ